MRQAKPIQDPSGKLESIIGVISNPSALAQFTARRFGSGPSLYFYQKLLSSRSNAANVDSFVGQQENLELGYSLLGLWGMDTRGARLKDFPSFSAAVKQVRAELVVLETALAQRANPSTMQQLRIVYDGLHIMESDSKLISNAKLLHYFFPEHLMPMDGENTLPFFYGTKITESTDRYADMMQFLFDLSAEITRRSIDWTQCKDKGWNSTFPKIVDNAIFSLMKS